LASFIWSSTIKSLFIERSPHEIAIIMASSHSSGLIAGKTEVRPVFGRA
jgi:hypothetical protein